MSGAGAGDVAASHKQSSGWRFYRMTAILVWGLLFGAGGGAITIAYCVLEYYVHRHGSVAGLIGGLVAIVVVFGGLTVWMVATGVREIPEGLVTFANFSREFVAWDDIASIGVASTLFGERVTVTCKSGRIVVLALGAQKEVLWRGGSTTEPVVMLRDRVNAVLVSRGLEPLERGG